MTQSAEAIERLIRDSFSVVEPVSTEFSVSDLFKDSQNHPAGIRAPHAIEALQDARYVDRWTQGDDSSMWLALSSKTETRPYDALITAIQTDPMGPQPKIEQAWRLYGDWPDTPTGALAAFIARFGIQVLVGGGAARGLFVSSWTGKTTEKVNVNSKPGQSFTVSALFRQDASGPAHLSWVYAIDDGAYRSYVARNR